MHRRPIIGILTGTLLLAACQGEERSEEPRTQADAEISALRLELAAQREFRAALEAKLAAQRDRIEELSAGAPPPEAAGAPPREAVDPAAEATAETTDASGPVAPRTWFDDESLLGRDLPPHEVERIREHFEHLQMAQIELQHSAMRENWFKTSRYREARHQIDSDFRREIGDEDYDLLLYGSRRRNRVAVADVVDRSPGFIAGFRAGDVILRYDGVRIFHSSEVQQSSSSGKLGESVPVEVLRDGEIVRLYIDRGPMGFGLKHRLMWPHHLR